MGDRSAARSDELVLCFASPWARRVSFQAFALCVGVCCWGGRGRLSAAFYLNLKGFTSEFIGFIFSFFREYKYKIYYPELLDASVR